MNDKHKPYLPFLVGGSIFLLAMLLSGFLIGLVGGIAGGLLVYFFIGHSNNKQKSKPEPEVKVETPEDKVNASVEALLALNIEIRKTKLEPAVRDTLESTIDQLLSILPRVKEVAPDGELFWVVNRMATQYLPEKSVRPYLVLTSDQRKESVSNFLVGLAGIQSEIHEISDLLNAKNINEFETKAKFLKTRFNV